MDVPAKLSQRHGCGIHALSPEPDRGGGQCLGQRGGAELIADLLQAPGDDAGAGQEFDGGLAHGQAQRRSGYSQPGQAK